ncbi:MAG: endo-1,4-beta-xylanase [Patescibacteria group bacterium]
MKLNKFKIFLIAVLLLAGGFYVLSLRPLPQSITYGVSFSRFHSDELKLDWKKTYLAILDDLKVKHLRLTAHWPLTQPKDGVYNFSEMDFQIEEAEKRNASVILAVGRRLPGWPECHTPDWVSKLPLDQQGVKLLEYIETVVNRYKKSPAIKYWQVENEVFLAFFGKSLCGQYSEGIEDFLKEEINLVNKLDPSRQVIVTDSGEFGIWYKAYRNGDVFGTSMYLYVWWRNAIGPLRYPITPAFFKIKHNVMRLFFGPKPSMVIELSAEPWLLQPIVDTPIDVQFQRMGIDKFNEMINFSSKTGFDTFYLWGAEWWYWLKQQGYPEHWNRAKELYRNSP